jgi:hypothetical protein
LPITDVGLKEIGKLKNLTDLHIGNTKVTDDGLKEIYELRNLTSLRIKMTRISDAGVKELKRSLPNLKIER